MKDALHIEMIKDRDEVMPTWIDIDQDGWHVIKFFIIFSHRALRMSSNNEYNKNKSIANVKRTFKIKRTKILMVYIKVQNNNKW